MGPRTLAFLLLLSAGLAPTARAQTLLIPEFSGDDPGATLRARGGVLKAVGGVSGLRIAPLSKLKKLAKTLGLDPSQLGNSTAAKTLCKPGELGGILAGSLDVAAGGARTLHIQFFDARGLKGYAQDFDLGTADPKPEQLSQIAHGVAQALGLEATPAPAAVTKSPPPGGAADAGAPPDARASADAGASGTDGGAAAKPEPAKPEPAKKDEGDEHLEAPAVEDMDPSRLERWEDPLIGIEIGATGTLLSSILYNDEVLANAVDVESGFTPGVMARLSSYPFHAGDAALSGLGIQAYFSFDTFNLKAPSETVTTTDMRLGAYLSYRLRLPFTHDDDGIYSPSIGLRAGVQMWRFDPPGGNTVEAYPLNRFGPLVGAEIIEPFGHFVRVVVGGQYVFAAYPGTVADANSIENALYSAETFNTNFSFDLEAQIHVGQPNRSGLSIALRGSYTAYLDCFEQTAGQGCYFNNNETSIDVWLLLGYAFY